jgi:hypothetical protein
MSNQEMNSKHTIHAAIQQAHAEYASNKKTRVKNGQAFNMSFNTHHMSKCKVCKGWCNNISIL